MTSHLPECPCATTVEGDWHCCVACNPEVVPAWERKCICAALHAHGQRVVATAIDVVSWLPTWPSEHAQQSVDRTAVIHALQFARSA